MFVQAQCKEQAPVMKPLDILLVEDTTSDALLLRHSLETSQVPYTLRLLSKGDEVLPWLSRELAGGRHRLPDVIMLDLGLPCVDGFGVLEDLAAAHPALRALPVIILTGYEHFEYISANYNVCVAAYITKPCTSDKMRGALASLKNGRSVKS